MKSVIMEEVTKGLSIFGKYEDDPSSYILHVYNGRIFRGSDNGKIIHSMNKEDIAIVVSFGWRLEGELGLRSWSHEWM